MEVTTSSYEQLVCKDSRIRVIHPTRLFELAGTLFDVIVSFSSLEHDGLGR